MLKISALIFTFANLFHEVGHVLSGDVRKVLRIGGQGHGVAGRVSVIGEGCVGRRFGAPPEDVPHAAQQLFVARVARTRPATCYKETTDPVGPTVVESTHRTRACLLHSIKQLQTFN
jgi:hypothetical protein